MCQRESLVNIVCNSGATQAIIIGTPRGVSYKKSFCIGDIVKVAIQKTAPGSNIKKGQVKNAVLIRTKNRTKIFNDIICSFMNNAIVLLDERFFPISNTIKCQICRSLLDLSVPGLLKLSQISRGV